MKSISAFFGPEQIVALCVFFLANTSILHAQIPDSVTMKDELDSVELALNMDAVYERPMLNPDRLPVALGGYIEANSIYSIEDGISEGLSFQARRLTLFMSGSIAPRIKFLSEMEFEDGTKEIAIEFAAVDVAIHPMLNIRGGVVMNPIGAFNQNHDGPKWEFVERPDVAVQLLPATWSNAGFGLYGKTHSGDWVFGYEAYLTNGFDDRIIDNEESKTFLPASKENEERFEESSNGQPLFSGKIAIGHQNFGEIGISFMGGVFNRFEEDGLELDKKRRIDVLALDFQTTIHLTGTKLVGEAAFAWIDIPESYSQQYGNKQMGYFLDLVQPVIRGKISDWANATVNLALRIDYVDWNMENFRETGTAIGDEIFAITPALSFRPSSQTVFRLNYRYQKQKDLFRNPASKTATWYLGLSTYF